eukprot:jgi/Galph1/483/GphlegSOOS_G5254.1
MALNSCLIWIVLLYFATFIECKTFHGNRIFPETDGLYRWNDDSYTSSQTQYYFTPYISETPTVSPYYKIEGVVRLGFVNNTVIYCNVVPSNNWLFPPVNSIQVNTTEQLKAERLILSNGGKYGVNQVIYEGKIRPFSAAFDVFLPLDQATAYDQQILTNMTFQNNLRKILNLPRKFLFYSEILVGIPSVTPTPLVYSYTPSLVSTPTISYYPSFSPYSQQTIVSLSPSFTPLISYQPYLSSYSPTPVQYVTPTPYGPSLGIFLPYFSIHVVLTKKLVDPFDRIMGLKM